MKESQSSLLPLPPTPVTAVGYSAMMLPESRQQDVGYNGKLCDPPRRVQANSSDEMNSEHTCRSDRTADRKASGDVHGDGSVKWKLVQSPRAEKSSRFTLDIEYQIQRFHAKSISPTARVCSDCNTTSTPLWRSGPQGPKSLCNACGIRQRKARKVAAAAAAMENASSAVAEEAARTISKPQPSKEKKPRSGFKDNDCLRSEKKLCFGNITLNLRNDSTFARVFSQDVEEAAMLLMELSCGFVHTNS